MAGIWNPWRGCHRRSEGCKYCYIHKGDAKSGADTGSVVKTDKFNWPVRRNKKGEYSVKPGQTVFLCFTSDFLVEDADAWRGECWDMMRERGDLHFLFLTKRIERFMACAPPDWGDGWNNVTVGCSAENQRRADERLAVLARLPIRHKNIICQPLVERVDISPWLEGMELVVVGGESGRNARPLHYDWVLDIRRQCVEAGVPFEFRQCGTHFVKDGVEYTLQVKDLGAQARKADINT